MTNKQRIRKWSKNVQPIQDVDAFINPYYFIFLDEILDLLYNYRHRINGFRVDGIMYSLLEIDQIVHN